MSALPLLPLLALLGADVTDLGVLTPQRVIVLERCTNRTDLLKWEVELHHPASRSTTTLTTTNSHIRAEQLDSFPDGNIVMSVTQHCADGATSEPALFRFDLRRAPPSLPRARIIGLLTTNTLTNRVLVPNPLALQPGPVRLQRPMAEHRAQADATPPPPLPASRMTLHYDRPGLRRSE